MAEPPSRSRETGARHLEEMHPIVSQSYQLYRFVLSDNKAEIDLAVFKFTGMKTLKLALSDQSSFLFTFKLFHFASCCHEITLTANSGFSYRN